MIKNLLGEFRPFQEELQRLRAAFEQWTADYFRILTENIVRDIEADNITIFADILDCMQGKKSVEKISALLAKQSQIKEYLDFANQSMIQQFLALKDIFNLFVKNNIYDDIKEELQAQYLELTDKSEQPQQRPKAVAAYEETQLVNLPHRIKQYVERFNPEEVTITCGIFQEDFYVTGGWDGSIVVFDKETVYQDISEAFSSPIKRIWKLRNGLFFILDEHNEFKLASISKNAYKLLKKGQLISQQDVIRLDEDKLSLKLQLDNGYQIILSYINGLNSQELLLMRCDYQEEQGNKILHANDCLQVAVNYFSTPGGVCIQSREAMNGKGSHFEFKISDSIIKHSLILDEDTTYFIDGQNNVYRNDEKLEFKAEQVFEGGIFSFENTLRIGELIIETQIENIRGAYINGSELIVIGGGPKQIQILKLQY